MAKYQQNSFYSLKDLNHHLSTQNKYKSSSIRGFLASDKDHYQLTTTNLKYINKLFDMNNQCNRLAAYYVHGKW